ncbi:MAG: FHA domain-containing protein [Planctomycetia bacterium]|nr:FHA domain-containing protein [Planctomycetia bacterium]
MQSLTVLQGNDKGKSFQLLDQIIAIGRDETNGVQLHDPEVSRQHARITVFHGRCIITDLKSSNGIYLNGVLVQESPISHGDHVQIGRTLLVFSDDEQDEGKEAAVTFQIADKPDQSRIIHTLGPEAGEGLFQGSGEDKLESTWLRKARAHLNLIYHTTLVVSQTLDIDKLLDRIMSLIFEWVNVDRGCILLYTPEENKLIPTVSKTREGVHGGQTTTISKTMLDYVLKSREGVLTSDAQADERWEPAESIVQMGIREAICVPMQGRYGLVGVIYIDTTRRMGEQDLLPGDDRLSRSSSGRFFGRDSFSIGEEGKFGDDSQKENLLFSKDALASESRVKTNPTAQKLTSDHLKLMVAIGHQAALAVEDTRYYLGMVQAERLAAVGQTVAILSHHIKNILQGIRGGSYLIDLGLKEHKEDYIHKGWGIVEKNQGKISDLVLDMLTLSKERKPLLEYNDLNRVLLDVMELMQGRACDLNVKLTWHLLDDIPDFYFDAEQIHRAITNLVTNAIDAAAENAVQAEAEELSETDGLTEKLNWGRDSGDSNKQSTSNQDGVQDDYLLTMENVDSTTLDGHGHVDVRTILIEQHNVVLVMVDDNGPGISDEMKDQLFRPFFSANKSTGTGLGLAVTNKIIHEHQGRLEVNRSPLGGARFIAELPLLREKPDAASAED